MSFDFIDDGVAAFSSRFSSQFCSNTLMTPLKFAKFAEHKEDICITNQKELYVSLKHHIHWWIEIPE